MFRVFHHKVQYVSYLLLFRDLFKEQVSQKVSDHVVHSVFAVIIFYFIFMSFILLPHESLRTVTTQQPQI